MTPRRSTSLPALAALVLAGAATVAQAAPKAVPPAYAPVFTGALVSTYNDGRQGKLWLSADGSFVGVSRRGARNAGSWVLETARLCLRQSRPIPIPFRYCQPLPATLSGSWRGKAPSGEPISIRFVEGDRP